MFTVLLLSVQLKLIHTGGAESVERAESIERTFEMPDKLGSNKKNMKY